MAINPAPKPRELGAGACPTRLVPDSPAEQDRFGPHREIAAAITSLVRTEEGGRSIGLSGRWGAGKSTVIGLLRTNLAQYLGYRVWVFDAWAHEGDPLRRTFLESLIEFLREAKWIDGTRWAIRLDELARRRKVSEQRVSPRLSRIGWILTASLLLIPIGAALLTHGLQQGVTVSRNAGPVNIAFILGLLLMTAPLSVVLFVVCGAELRSRLSVRAGRSAESPDYGEIFAVFVQRAVTNLRTETIETPEPTSIEFETTFSDLMGEALNEKPRRLVLVIDNLDRIDAGEALKIWSTLQTFLQHSVRRAEWLKQVWVIMPFDSESILKLWQKQGTEDVELATAFLDKSFQITFDVPTPLMSDWREYLLETLQTALPQHNEEEFHAVYRLVALRSGNATRTPTPREIKLIVNQIGALHRQRGDAVPLAHMAYYALLSRQRVKVVDELLAGNLPAVGEAGLVGDGVRDSLAALAFGVEPSRARQLLLEAPILDALAKPDADRLAGLSGTSEGFVNVLEQAVAHAATDWPRAEGGKVLHAVVALTDSGLLADGKKYRDDELAQVLVRAAWRIETLLPISEAAERGIVLLATRSGNSALAKHLFDAYVRTVAHAPNEQSVPTPPRVVALAMQLS